jgi:fucokinase
MSLEEWWQHQRVLMIHSGGDSRRLPEYSLAGKLFSALPIKTPWGEVSTVFDETLALSTMWAERVSSGLVVSSGDVVLTFPAGQLAWHLPGVCGAAMRQPVEIGSQHGVYVLGDSGRVYSFLQKPSAAEVRAAGGILPGEQVALDIGLLRFDAQLCARLAQLAGVSCDNGGWNVGKGILDDASGRPPAIDLYQHVSLALTGDWVPNPDDHPAWRAVAEVFRGIPFWCSLVDGDFTHIGTTSHFQRLMTEATQFTDLYEAHQRLGAVSAPGVRSAGVIVDSVFASGAELETGCLAIECQLSVPLRAAR